MYPFLVKQRAQDKNVEHSFVYDTKFYYAHYNVSTLSFLSLTHSMPTYLSLIICFMLCYLSLLFFPFPPWNDEITDKCVCVCVSERLLAPSSQFLFIICTILRTHIWGNSLFLNFFLLIYLPKYRAKI
jgi:hypothetical protein